MATTAIHTAALPMPYSNNDTFPSLTKYDFNYKTLFFVVVKDDMKKPSFQSFNEIFTKFLHFYNLLVVY